MQYHGKQSQNGTNADGPNPIPWLIIIGINLLVVLFQVKCVGN
jgi:hypothetical protein